jgi:hypothetical protein
MVARGREEGLSRAWWEIWDIDVYDITQVFDMCIPVLQG